MHNQRRLDPPLSPLCITLAFGRYVIGIVVGPLSSWVNELLLISGCKAVALREVSLPPPYVFYSLLNRFLLLSWTGVPGDFNSTNDDGQLAE